MRRAPTVRSASRLTYATVASVTLTMSAPEVASSRERRERNRIDRNEYVTGAAWNSPSIIPPCRSGLAFHERTAPLAESLSFRDWAGYYAVSSYETHHDHEYNAIRNACALIDISPLFKYRVRGPGATRLVNRIITRDVARLQVGQVWYTPWCDEDGMVIDDGTVTRLADDTFRWTAAHPNLRWLVENAHGLDVEIEDITEQVAALALQGPTSRALLAGVCAAPIDGLKYFRAMPTRSRASRWTFPARATRAISATRSGCRWDRALAVWDALAARGAPSTCMPRACWRWTSRASKPGCC